MQSRYDGLCGQDEVGWSTGGVWSGLVEEFGVWLLVGGDCLVSGPPGVWGGSHQSITVHRSGQGSYAGQPDLTCPALNVWYQLTRPDLHAPARQPKYQQETQ